MAMPAQFIVAGIGCRKGADAAEIIALIEGALIAANHTPSTLLAIASLDRKAAEPGLLQAAASLGVPLRLFTPGQLAQLGAGSARVEALVGTPSVAVAAASLAGSLLSARRQSSSVTCALAAVGPDFDLMTFGQPAADAVPASTAATAESRVLTANAGP